MWLRFEAVFDDTFSLQLLPIELAMMLRVDGMCARLVLHGPPLSLPLLF
jgi:hypothetical protein